MLAGLVSSGLVLNELPLKVLSPNTSHSDLLSGIWLQHTDFGGQHNSANNIRILVFILRGTQNY